MREASLDRSRGRDRLPRRPCRLRPVGGLRGDFRRARQIRAARSGCAGAPVRFGSPRDAIAAGVGMAPEDRKEAGLFLTMDVASNISVAVLDRVSEGGMVSSAQKRRAGRPLHRRFAYRDARRSGHQLANLSGGNQQKVMLAKWLALDPAAAHRRRADARRRRRRTGRNLPDSANARGAKASRCWSSRPTCRKCWRSPTASWSWPTAGRSANSTGRPPTRKPCCGSRLKHTQAGTRRCRRGRGVNETAPTAAAPGRSRPATQRRRRPAWRAAVRPDSAHARRIRAN